MDYGNLCTRDAFRRARGDRGFPRSVLRARLQEARCIRRRRRAVGFVRSDETKWNFLSRDRYRCRRMDGGMERAPKLSRGFASRWSCCRRRRSAVYHSVWRIFRPRRVRQILVLDISVCERVRVPHIAIAGMEFVCTWHNDRYTSQQAALACRRCRRGDAVDSPMVPAYADSADGISYHFDCFRLSRILFSRTLLYPAGSCRRVVLRRCSSLYTPAPQANHTWYSSARSGSRSLCCGCGRVRRERVGVPFFHAAERTKPGAVWFQSLCGSAGNRALYSSAHGPRRAHRSVGIGTGDLFLCEPEIRDWVHLYVCAYGATEILAAHAG